MKKICNMESIPFPDIESIKEKKEGVCPVKQMLDIVTSAHKATCGLGIMCRDGIYQLYTILKDIVNRNSESNDLALIKDICQVMVICNECELSVKTAELLLASIEAHEREWEKHIQEKQCSEKICIYQLYIDPNKCDGCNKCKDACDYDAIAGEEGLIHVLNRNRCRNCGKCEATCEKNAVARAGQNVPRCPEAPIPAGTFTTGLGLKRRRPVRP